MTMEEKLTYEAKLAVLNALKNISTKEELDELRTALSKFFMDRGQSKLDMMWNEGKITQDNIERWGQGHLRTSYINE